MEETFSKSRICPLCGKTIYYKVIEEDGRDWMGHQRGKPSTRTIGYDCGCTIDKFKRMCLNCKHCVNSKCTSQGMINRYNLQLKHDMFDVGIVNNLKIKDPTKSCEFWELHSKIGNTIFK